MSRTIGSSRAYLERIGWRVEECDGGVAAMTYLQHHAPQAMLIDMRMPDVNGEQLAAFVRSEPSLSKVRLVGYTASSFADEIARFRAAGFDEVLIKPVLLSNMRQALPDPRPAVAS